MKNLGLIDKTLLLKQTRFFGDLDLDLLLPISDKMSAVMFEKGDKIFTINQEAHRMYLIVKGTVQIIDVHQKPLALLSSGEFFGDESIFNERPRAYEAIAKTDTVLLTLSRTNLMTIISESPSVAVSLLQAYASMMSFRPRHLKESDK